MWKMLAQDNTSIILSCSQERCIEHLQLSTGTRRRDNQVHHTAISRGAKGEARAE